MTDPQFEEKLDKLINKTDRVANELSSIGFWMTIIGIIFAIKSCWH
jgi:hypothetical protein